MLKSLQKNQINSVTRPAQKWQKCYETEPYSVRNYLRSRKKLEKLFETHLYYQKLNLKAYLIKIGSKITPQINFEN